MEIIFKSKNNIMAEKPFKVAQVRDLLNQVYNDEMSFSRFVEILNEKAESKRFDIKKLDNEWTQSLDKGLGLNPAEEAAALIDIKNKINELIFIIEKIK